MSRRYRREGDSKRCAASLKALRPWQSLTAIRLDMKRCNAILELYRQYGVPLSREIEGPYLTPCPGWEVLSNGPGGRGPGCFCYLRCDQCLRGACSDLARENTDVWVVVRGLAKNLSGRGCSHLFYLEQAPAPELLDQLALEYLAEPTFGEVPS